MGGPSSSRAGSAGGGGGGGHNGHSPLRAGSPGAAAVAGHTSSRPPSLGATLLAALLALNALLLWRFASVVGGATSASAALCGGLPLSASVASSSAASLLAGGSDATLARLGFASTGEDALAFIRDVVVPPWFPPRHDAGRAGAAAEQPPGWQQYPDDPPDPSAWRLSTGPTATDPDFRARHARLDAYLKKSRAFRERVEKLRAIPDDDPDLGAGIVMVAGGKYYLPQAVVALRLLRKHVGSSLPVEIFWNGEGEGVDAEALRWLAREFAPLTGRDARVVAREAERAAAAAELAEGGSGGSKDKAEGGHYAPHTQETLKGFALKSFALLHTRFKRALLLDCDVILLSDPRALFFNQGFSERGAWLWPDIYGAGMVQSAAYGIAGLKAEAEGAVDAAKGEFSRHAESGQVLVDRSRHLDALEWTWLLNAFGDKTGLYKKVYGDKDTFALGYALAGKAWAAQHVPVPPAGVFSHRQTLGMGESDQLNRQGNWWLNALLHYEPPGGADGRTQGRPLLLHRVTGEVGLGRPAPRDELVTPPVPMAWSMWHMGFGPGKEGVQRTLELTSGNATYWEEAAGDAKGGPAGNGAERRAPAEDSGDKQRAPSGELASCPLAAWSSHWLMLSHGVPASPAPMLERRCAAAMLPAQYGAEGAALLRRSGVVRLGAAAGGGTASSSYVSGAPMRLAINRAWDAPPRGYGAGEWKAPAAPLFAVPVNQTALWGAWKAMAEATDWMSAEAPKHIKALKEEDKGRRRRRRRRQLAGVDRVEEEEEAEGSEEEAPPPPWRRHHAAGLSARLVVARL